MEEIKNSLERYYQGVSTLAEEQVLKEQYRNGNLSEEQIFSFRGKHPELSIDLQLRITTAIHHKKRVKLRRHLLRVTSIAALLILSFFIREFVSPPTLTPISDQQKKECFEDALLTIGRLLNETSCKEQNVIYEDDYITIFVK